MKKIGLAILVAAIVSGCASTSDINLKQERFTSNVKIAEYNDLANKYMDKATFAKVMRMDTLKGDTVKYQAESYNPLYVKGQGYLNEKLEIVIHVSDISQVMEAIAKYEKWEAKATLNGDMIEKDILEFDSGFNSTMSYKLGFYSGNPSTHYLTITKCGLLGRCGSAKVFLSKKSVEALKYDVEKLKSGELAKLGVDDGYN